MAALRFLDTNVFLRYLTRSDLGKAESARRLLERVERGDEKVATSQMVVFEVVFTLQHSYKVPKPQVREMVGDLLSLPGIQLAGKRLIIDALDPYVERNVSFADAYNAVYMRWRRIGEIYSWDADFDHLPGITRIQP